jgi:hypothetical protein
MRWLPSGGTELSASRTTANTARVPRLGRALALRRLSTMLRSTLQKWPTALLWRRKGGYGALLGGGIFLHVSFSTRLTAAEQRDLLMLFAVWLVADPERLLSQDTHRGGSYWRDTAALD